VQRVSVSNIAWPQADEPEALRLALELGFSGIEIAPAKTFGSWAEATVPRAAAYRRDLAALGLDVPAMQGILFGLDDHRLFGTGDERARLKAHLENLARLAGALGAKACVFGAPRNRDPGDLPATEAMTRAVDFFASVAPAYANEGSALAFEANAALYNCRFVQRTEQAIELARRVDHPGIRIQLDTGTIFINDEPRGVVEQAALWAAHFHASEPRLAPVGSAGSDHAEIGRRLRGTGFAGWRSVEMTTVPDWRAALRGAAAVMKAHYA
jgi:D-psicose/D-tagatose/L-ribulose 3-epimerase